VAALLNEYYKIALFVSCTLSLCIKSGKWKSRANNEDPHVMWIYPIKTTPKTYRLLSIAQL
jgi:hypothetical protein